MGAAGGIGSLGRRSTVALEETGERYSSYVRSLLASHPCPPVPLNHRGKFCIYNLEGKLRGESAICLLPFTQMPIIEELPLLLPLPRLMLYTAPQSSHYGQSSCNGFCVFLDILQNCILVHPKQKRKQICLTCFLCRNRELHTMRKPSIWHSDNAACCITFSLPRTDVIPDWAYSGAFASTSLIGKFIRIKCWVLKYFPLIFIHGQFKSLPL